MRQVSRRRWRLAMLLPVLLTPILVTAQDGGGEPAANAVETATPAETVQLKEEGSQVDMLSTARPQDQVSGSFLPHPKYIDRFSHARVRVRLKPPKQKKAAGADGPTTKQLLATKKESMAKQAKRGLSAPDGTTVTEPTTPAAPPAPLFSLQGASPTSDEEETRP